MIFVCSKCGGDLEKPRVHTRYAVCLKCKKEKNLANANKRYKMYKDYLAEENGKRKTRGWYLLKDGVNFKPNKKAVFRFPAPPQIAVLTDNPETETIV